MARKPVKGSSPLACCGSVGVAAGGAGGAGDSSAAGAVPLSTVPTSPRTCWVSSSCRYWVALGESSPVTLWTARPAPAVLKSMPRTSMAVTARRDFMKVDLRDRVFRAAERSTRWRTVSSSMPVSSSREARRRAPTASRSSG